jgi:hypothetical protein
MKRLAVAAWWRHRGVQVDIFFPHPDQLADRA